MDILSKYLKYKQKYLNLKNLIGGFNKGDVIFIKYRGIIVQAGIINIINEHSDGESFEVLILDGNLQNTILLFTNEELDRIHSQTQPLSYDSTTRVELSTKAADSRASTSSLAKLAIKTSHYVPEAQDTGQGKI